MTKIVLIGNYSNDRLESMVRYTKMLAYGLKQSGREVEIVSPKSIVGRLVPSAEGVGKWLGYIDKFILFPLYLLWHTRTKNRNCKVIYHIVDQSNAVYGPVLRGRPYLVTCHDMLAIRAAIGEFPMINVGFSGRIYQRWICWSLMNCRNICSVSEYTRSDIARLLLRAEDEIRVVENPLSFTFRPMSEGEANRHLLEMLFGVEMYCHWSAIRARGYIMHIGSNVWYKNRMGVVEIYYQLKRRLGQQCPVLIMAGKPPTAEIRDYVASHGLDDSVYFVGSVTDNVLNALYAEAKLLLFPSIAEGFGWPIVEAQATGCPVVTTDAPPMNEIGGPAAYLVEGCPLKGDLAAREGWACRCARVVEVVLNEPKESLGIRQRLGQRNAAERTVERMIEGYCLVYRELVRPTS